MELSYNVDEIFEIAEQIERNGAEFYRKAAGFSQDDARTFLLHLAEQEEQHERTFSDLRSTVVAEQERVAANDQDDVVAGYLRAMAGQYVFHKEQSPADALTGQESLTDIVALAVQQEKDSILLYLGLMDAMARGDDRDRIRLIVREEQQHLADLLKKQGAR